jgi:hypothetical protein
MVRLATSAIALRFPSLAGKPIPRFRTSPLRAAIDIAELKKVS